jgi:hypothetical protein
MSFNAATQTIDALRKRNEELIDDAARWRWITRDGRTRELRIPADESKKSIDAAIDSVREKK